MCGIAGELNWARPPDAEAVAAMTSCLAHRGPDGDGLVVDGPVALGHRRLVVIDPSEASAQPFTDASTRVRLVYNGEIYNFRELRSELEAEGVDFRTDGDVEVVVEAYKRWGSRCFERFNGMFALALWDASLDRLVLARDRLGKKPLFYQRLDGSVVFASELRALRKHPRVSTTIDPEALSQYLSLNYVLHDRSILSGVEKLAPAHYLEIGRHGASRPVSYWDLASSFRQKATYSDEGEAAEALNELLDDAVRLRLVSDVPLGAFLSGGVDSSIIVESMSRLRPPSSNLTFSMGFTEDSYSELPKARAVATGLGVTHRDTTADLDVSATLPSIVRHGDEPFADTSTVPFFHLAEFARRRVTVCLSGDGADEIAAGYPTHAADRLHARLGWLPGGLVRGTLGLVDALWPVSFDKVSFDYKLRQFLGGLALSAPRAHHHWRTIMTPALKRTLFAPAHNGLADVDGFEVSERYFSEVADCHYLDQAMYVDIKTWLPDDILHKVDRASMAHSLEARAPFLDYRVVEFFASLPVEWKMKGLRQKYLLKRARADRLPGSILNQKKQGFNAPVSQWLLGAWEDLAGRATATDRLSEWLRPEAVETLWREHSERRRDHGLRLFGMACLGLWLEEAG
ncbi:MAG: asparagine synthase (glutamine-hydrolyzing) [Thermoanaerobaculia bacterium]